MEPLNRREASGNVFDRKPPSNHCATASEMISNPDVARRELKELPWVGYPRNHPPESSFNAPIKMVFEAAELEAQQSCRSFRISDHGVDTLGKGRPLGPPEGTPHTPQQTPEEDSPARFLQDDLVSSAPFGVRDHLEKGHMESDRATVNEGMLLFKVQHVGSWIILAENEPVARDHRVALHEAQRSAWEGGAQENPGGDWGS